MAGKLSPPGMTHTESSANEDEESPREDEIPVSAADPVFAILEARLSVSAGLV